MPGFSPFRGVRYEPGRLDAPPGESRLDALTAPPYDVIDPDARAALAARSPYNAVRLILPDEGPDPYGGAAALLARWRREGVLARDARPRFYRVTMRFTDDRGGERATVGVLGALALPRGGPTDPSGGILPHEQTLPKAKSDRLKLLRATRANLDPIWGLSLAPELSERLSSVAAAPLATTVDEHGVAHELAPIDDPDAIDAIRRSVGAAPLVLADGHHRFETACTYRDECASRPDRPAGAGAVLGLVVELAPSQLWVQPIHRLLSAPGADVRAAATGTYEVHDAGPNTPDGVTALLERMRATGGVGLADRRGLALLVPRAGALAARLADLPPAVRETDAAAVAAGILAALPDAVVTYRHDAQHGAALVDKQAYDAALLLRPVPIETIRAAAEAGVRMPPKSTFFAPKPRTGLVFRLLDDDDDDDGDGDGEGKGDGDPGD